MGSEHSGVVWLFLKHHRTGGFHKRTNKELTVLKRAVWFGIFFKGFENQGSVTCLYLHSKKADKKWHS
jgi:predicted cupin superfamily sugar epimerase